MSDIDDLERYRLGVLLKLGYEADALEPHFDVSADEIPHPEPVLRCNDMRILAGPKHYVYGQSNTCVELVATRQAVEALAMVILSVMFHSDKERTVEICLNTRYAVPAPPHLSEIRRTVVENGWHAQDDFAGLSMRPFAFGHSYEETGRHPLRARAWSLQPRPHLHLANHDRVVGDESCKDTLFGFGTMLEAASLVGALLNIARDQTGDLYEFEGPRHYGGVTAGSAELKVWFPGSVGWELYPPTADENQPE